MGSRGVARGVLDRGEATTENPKTLEEKSRLPASLLWVGRRIYTSRRRNNNS